MQAKIFRDIPKTEHKVNLIQYSLIDYGIGKVKLQDEKTGETSLSQEDCFWIKIKIINTDQHKIEYVSYPYLKLMDNYGNEYPAYSAGYPLKIVGSEAPAGKLKPGESTTGLKIWSSEDFVENIKFLKIFGGWPSENFFTVLSPLSNKEYIAGKE